MLIKVTAIGKKRDPDQPNYKKLGIEPPEEPEEQTLDLKINTLNIERIIPSSSGQEVLISMSSGSKFRAKEDYNSFTQKVNNLLNK